MTTKNTLEWVTVPRVATKEMMDAAWASALGEDASGVWSDMISAAPKHDQIEQLTARISELEARFIRASDGVWAAFDALKRQGNDEKWFKAFRK